MSPIDSKGWFGVISPSAVAPVSRSIFSDASSTCCASRRAIAPGFTSCSAIVSRPTPRPPTTPNSQSFITASTEALVGCSGTATWNVVLREGDGVVREVRQLTFAELGDGDALVKVSWSDVNYKDGLASTPQGKVARIDPIIPGVDLAGEIVEPGESGLAVGTEVIVHG